MYPKNIKIFKTLKATFSREIEPDNIYRNGKVEIYFHVKAYKDAADNIVVEQLKVLDEDGYEMDLIEEARDHLSIDISDLPK